MKKLTDFVIDREGNAVVGAEVYVKRQADETLKTLYSDNGVTGISNPTVTDNNGKFEFYTSDDTIYIEAWVDGALENTISQIQHYDDLDNEVAALRSVTSAADTLFYFTGSGSGSVTTLTAFIRTLLDDADAATARATLGLSSAALALPLTFNFSSDSEARFYADVAMTLTEQADSGTGTVAYEKSTNAAPDTFNSTTSPITLEAGAWLKVSATSVIDIFSVHLKRTA